MNRNFKDDASGVAIDINLDEEKHLSQPGIRGDDIEEECIQLIEEIIIQKLDKLPNYKSSYPEAKKGHLIIRVNMDMPLNYDVLRIKLWQRISKYCNQGFDSITLVSNSKILFIDKMNYYPIFRTIKNYDSLNITFKTNFGG